MLPSPQLKPDRSQPPGRHEPDLREGCASSVPLLGANRNNVVRDSRRPNWLQLRIERGRILWSRRLIVEANTAEAVEMIGGGGYALKILGGGATAVVSGGKLQLIDTAQNAKMAETARGRWPSPRGSRS